MRSLNSLIPSKRLIFSYLFDWIVILAIAAVGGGWEYIEPFHRPFSVVDLGISYPFEKHETIPTWLLVVVALVIPAGITFLICMILVPGPTASRGTRQSLVWKRKFWEWNTAWMGLALSLATAFMVTQGMKLLFGKPRPDFLSRCQPDLSRIPRPAALENWAVDVNPLWVMVTGDVCTQTDADRLKDGYKSFPSGHASFSWAGLLYLSLFLASKFSVTIPFLPPRPFSTDPAHNSAVAPSNLRSRATNLSASTNKYTAGSESSSAVDSAVVPLRYQAAAPPLWTVIFVLVPVASAIYITSTRFTDYRHHGFDLLFGSAIGIIAAWFSFRLYHLPVTRGAGWAWGPRSYKRAFGIGVGVGSYVGTEGWSHHSQSETRAPLHAPGHEEPRGDEAV